MNNVSTGNAYQQLEDVLEQENETIITMNNETDLFLHEGEEEDDDENGTGYVMQAPFKETRNAYKIYIISGFFTVILVISLVLLFFSKGDDSNPFKKIFDKDNRITLKNVFSEQLRQQKNDLFWFDYGDDGTIVQVGQEGNIELYNVVNKNSITVASIMDLSQMNNIKQGMLSLFNVNIGMNIGMYIISIN